MEKGSQIDLPRAPLRIRPWTRRRRVHSVTRYATLACLAILVYYITFKGTPAASLRRHRNGLSVQRLHEQLAACKLLRSVPAGPSGPREVNKRWIAGTKPVLILNATIWTGEPSPGTSAEDARKGVGYAWISSNVLVDRGLITRVSQDISTADLPADCEVHDARGRQLTAGVVDMHSHAGLDDYGGLGDDTNELSDNITPYVKSIDGFDPLSPAIRLIKSGGVTTSLILPGSGNNMGGEAFVLKMAAGRAGGRAEVSQEDLFADPDKTWRYMKMACGENPKGVYGKVGRGPFSRLGEGWAFRHAFEQAREYVQAQDDWCRTAETVGVDNMESYLPSELRWESLGAVLRGQVRVNTHCYTVKDLEAYVRLTNDFKFRVYAFHHAHQTYLVPEVLKRAYGGTPATALFADSSQFKDKSRAI
jgi:imidazolonepropionase-like amidohydrolase